MRVGRPVGRHTRKQANNLQQAFQHFQKSYWVVRKDSDMVLSDIKDESLKSELFEDYSCTTGQPTVMMTKVSKRFGSKEVRNHCILYSRIALWSAVRPVPCEPEVSPSTGNERERECRIGEKGMSHVPRAFEGLLVSIHHDPNPNIVCRIPPATYSVRTRETLVERATVGKPAPT